MAWLHEVATAALCGSGTGGTAARTVVVGIICLLQLRLRRTEVGFSCYTSSIAERQTSSIAALKAQAHSGHDAWQRRWRRSQ